jgi:hypothetical protein
MEIQVMDAEIPQEIWVKNSKTSQIQKDIAQVLDNILCDD